MILVLVKANRNLRAWLILLPLGAVFTLWGITKDVLSLPSELMAVFDQQFASVAIGFSILLLLGHKIGNRNRFATFMLALLSMVLLSIIGGISLGGSFSQEVTIYAILSFATAVLMLLSFVFAGLLCRKRFSYPKFTIWLGVWTTAGFGLFLLGYYLIAFVAMGDGMLFNIWEMLLQVVLPGLAIGGILFAILLPFMILTAKSEFFHNRLFACIRLESMEAISEADEAAVFGDIRAEMDNEIQPPGSG